jgi:hypothetical protein
VRRGRRQGGDLVHRGLQGDRRPVVRRRGAEGEVEDHRLAGGEGLPDGRHHRLGDGGLGGRAVGRDRVVHDQRDAGRLLLHEAGDRGAVPAGRVELPVAGTDVQLVDVARVQSQPGQPAVRAGLPGQAGVDHRDPDRAAGDRRGDQRGPATLRRLRPTEALDHHGHRGDVAELGRHGLAQGAGAVDGVAAGSVGRGDQPGHPAAQRLDRHGDHAARPDGVVATDQVLPADQQLLAADQEARAVALVVDHLEVRQLRVVLAQPDSPLEQLAQALGIRPGLANGLVVPLHGVRVDGVRVGRTYGHISLPPASGGSYAVPDAVTRRTGPHG